MATRLVRLCVLTVSLVAVVGTSTTAAAVPRGRGTMLVRQSTDCSGNGNVSTVALPFSVLFTGFTPGDTGIVTAYTQPGGVQVGQRTVSN